VGHVLRVIREVLYFKPRHRGTAFAPALDFLNHVAPRKTVSFVISDFASSEELARPLTITGKRHDLIAVVIRDRREQAWTPAGIIDWQDAESGRRCLVDTSDARTRRAFGALQAMRHERLLGVLRGAGVDAIPVGAGEAYEREFIRFFRLRERRLRL
jgi:uncharacterized protein (DUF58 family)